ncbi:MAG TPA: hypothetical protein VK116_07845 [Planctomycetota bacterium]|nr:hypothetical protein [Planctomycetota bacterium]
MLRGLAELVRLTIVNVTSLGEPVPLAQVPENLSQDSSVGPRLSERRANKERRRGDLAEPIVEEA